MGGPSGSSGERGHPAYNDGSGSLSSHTGNHGFVDSAEDLLDIIPAPTASSPHDASGGGGGGGSEGMCGYDMPSSGYHPDGDVGMSSSSSRSSPTVGCPDMLANIHMRLLDFLAWDRTRGLRCGREGKQDAYWRSLLPSVHRVGGSAGSSGGGGGGAGGANGEAAAGTFLTDEEEFGGAPETTLPGLQYSRELVQASPHGFPELLRLVAIHREGVVGRVETRRMAAERGFAGLGFRREGARGRDARVLQARVLDPLGEVMRILRHILKSEEAKPFVDVPSDEDVEPETETETDECIGEPGGERPPGSNGRAVEGGGGGVVSKKGKPEVKRPLDLGTILKRAENGWYDLEPGAEVR